MYRAFPFVATSNSSGEAASANGFGAGVVDWDMTGGGGALAAWLVPDMAATGAFVAPAGMGRGG